MNTGDPHPRGTARASSALLSAAMIALLLGAMTLCVRSLHQREIRDAKTYFRLDAHEQSAAVAWKIGAAFDQMYQGLRTIARLPGVRSIDRYADGFDRDARQTVQEIYNNLASTVAMSEVFIVPLDMDPDETDQRTGEPQAPIVTFDELIMGRTAGDDKPDRLELIGDWPDEIRIHEYRLARAQLNYLAAHFPTEASIKGLTYPAVCGPEVVTRDNSRFHPEAPNDKDRAGLVYSVPFYGPDGQLRGCVSGVLLSHAVSDLLPSGDYAVRNAAQAYTAKAPRAGSASDSAAFVAADTPDPLLPYSEMLEISVPDVQGRWMLWCGAPMERFTESEAVVAAARAKLWGYLACGAVAAGLTTAWLFGRRAIVQARSHAESLEGRIDERTKDLRVALHAAEDAARAKSAFLANMSHEIRTPMSAIVGYADLLHEPSHTSEEVRAYVNTIQRNGKHLLAMIDDILDLSKVDAGAMQCERIATDPAQIAGEVHALLNVRARQKQISLRLRVAPGVPREISSDPTRLRQVLNNLVGNAIKFTEAGEVSLEVDMPVERPGTLRFIVRDTGIGMTPAQMQCLFRPFTQADDSMTRRFGGTGLGLTISKRLAELLGGGIDVTSELRAGSTFTFWLRIEAASIPMDAAARRGSSGESGRANLTGVRVLLTEDGIDNQRLIAHVLRKAGAIVEIAENGADGSRLALDAQAAGRSFHIILMDMQMPIMDGYSAAKSLRAAGYSGPIIALTAHALSEDRQRCMAAGCDDFLTKPIDRAALVAACATWAASARAAA